MKQPNIVVAGANGNVGRVVVAMLKMLRERKGYDYRIVGMDVNSEMDCAADDYIQVPAAPSRLPQALRKAQAGMVIAMVPPDRVLDYAKAAHEVGAHHLDPTEVVETRAGIRALAKNAQGHYFAPHCGLAPGMCGIIAADMMKDMPQVDDVQIAVGALSEKPMGKLRHGLTWSPEGLVMEYLEPCEVLKDGKRDFVAPLAEGTQAMIGNETFDTISTSGGLGTMTETYGGRAQSMRYVSLRYPGHREAVLDWLKPFTGPDGTHVDASAALASARAESEKKDSEYFPRTDRDRVVMHLSASGRSVDGQPLSRHFEADFPPAKIEGRHATALQWTTAAGITGVAELMLDGRLAPSRKGDIIRQEDIPLPLFLSTVAGKLYAQHHPELAQIASLPAPNVVVDHELQAVNNNEPPTGRSRAAR